jgi:hypothetical protein
MSIATAARPEAHRATDSQASALKNHHCGGDHGSTLAAFQTAPIRDLMYRMVSCPDEGAELEFRKTSF